MMLDIGGESSYSEIVEQLQQQLAERDSQLENEKKKNQELQRRLSSTMKKNYSRHPKYIPVNEKQQQ